MLTFYLHLWKWRPLPYQEEATAHRAWEKTLGWTSVTKLLLRVPLVSWVRHYKSMFFDQVLMFNLCCCHRQLAPSCWPLISLAAKHSMLLATILLPLEMRKVARGNTVFLSAKVCHQTLPYSTDNHSTANTDLTLRDHSLHILKLVLICYVKGHLWLWRFYLIKVK